MLKHEIIANYCKNTGKDYDMVIDDAFRLYRAIEKPRSVLVAMVLCPEFFSDLSGTEEECKQAFFDAVKSSVVIVE